MNQPLHMNFRGTIANGVTQTVNAGGNAGTQAYASTMFRPRLSLGLFADQQLSLLLNVALDSNSTWRNAVTVVIAASTLGTVYNFVPPANTTGVWVCPWPVLQIQLTNASGALATVEFWARLEA